MHCLYFPIRQEVEAELRLFDEMGREVDLRLVDSMQHKAKVDQVQLAVCI